ncbi:hypothetical protein D3C73_1091310 [compost metagenome]
MPSEILLICPWLDSPNSPQRLGVPRRQCTSFSSRVAGRRNRFQQPQAIINTATTIIQGITTTGLIRLKNSSSRAAEIMAASLIPFGRLSACSSGLSLRMFSSSTCSLSSLRIEAFWLGVAFTTGGSGRS